MPRVINDMMHVVVSALFFLFSYKIKYHRKLFNFVEFLLFENNQEPLLNFTD